MGYHGVKACCIWGSAGTGFVFGSVVYNQAIVYKCQTFLKVVVHMIIIDLCNQTVH